MPTEIIHNDGKLYDMVCDNMSIFVERKNVRHLAIRTNDIGEEWGILQTTLGSAYIIEKYDMRKYRLKYLINKIKNNG